MNKGIFGLQVFRRRKPACKAVAVFTAFATLVTGSLPAFAAQTVLAPGADGKGGAIYTGIHGATYAGNGVDYGRFEASGAGGLIDWSKLNIGSGQTLEFVGNRFYNVVNGGEASQIAGTLNASGALWIFNPAGVSVMNGAQVNVGGLFGVAAANLANRDDIVNAIESGGVLPNVQLGAMAGNVTVEGGTFQTPNAAFLGRMVAVKGGDFSAVGNLSLVAAGGKVTVDEVEGGKISVNIDDFLDDGEDFVAADLENIGIVLGDEADGAELKLGGKAIDATFTAAGTDESGEPLPETGGAISADTASQSGNLWAQTEGSLTVKGAIKADGDIDLSTIANSGKTSSSEVIGHKKMSVASGKLLQGKSVSATAAGKISAADGSSIEALDGDVTLAAGLSIDVVNNVSGKNVTLQGTAGVTDGTTVKGAITATDTVKLSNLASVTDAEGATVTAKNLELDTIGEVSLNNGGVSAEKVSGNVTANANLKIGANLEIGDLTVGETLTVTPSDAQTVTATGEVSAKNIVSDLTQAAGTVTVEETLTGNLTQNAGNGGLLADKIVGNVVQGAADAKVNANVVDGALTQTAGTLTAKEVTGAAEVSGAVNGKDGELKFGSTLTQNAGSKIGNVSEGGEKTDAITVTGTLTQNGGEINAKSLDLKATTDKNTLNGTVKVDNALTANTDTDVSGTVIAGTVDATDKTVDVKSAGNVSAGTITASKVTTAGTVDATKVDGALTQTSGTLTTKEVTGAAEVSGTVNGKGGELNFGSTLTQNNGTITANGDMTVEGKLTQTAGEINATGNKLTLKDGADVSGKVTAGSVDATDKTVKTDGSANVTVDGDLKAATLDVDGGTVDATSVAVGGDLTQTDGTVEAGAVKATTVKQTGGTMTVDATKADGVTLDEGLEAGAIKANVVLQEKADGADTAGTITANKVDGTLDQSAGATLTAKEVTGAAEVSGAVNGKDGELKFGSTLTQNAGSKIGNVTAAGDKTDAVTVTGTLTQNGGEINAKSLDLKATTDKNTLNGTVAVDNALTANTDTDVSGTVTAGSVDATGKTVDVKSAGNVSAGTITASKVTTAGTVDATKIDGALTQTDGTLTTKEVTGAAEVSGTVNGKGGLKFGSTLAQKNGTITANGDMTVGGKLTQTAGTVDATGNKLTLKDGADVSGTVTAGSVDATDKTVKTDGSADVTVDGDLTAGKLDVDGGNVSAGKVVGSVDQSAGEIKTGEVTGTVDQSGGTLAAKGADLTIGGKLTQTKDEGSEALVSAEDGTLTLNGGAYVEGELKSEGIEAEGKEIEVAESGKLNVSGKVNANVTSSGNLEVNEYKGDLVQKKGSITTTKVTGSVTQSGGTLKSDSSLTINGDLKQTTEDNPATVKAATDLTIDGKAEVAGTVTAGGTIEVKGADGLTQNGGTIKATTITATKVSQDVDGAKIVANGTSLTINAAVTQTKGQIGNVSEGGEKTDAITVTGTLTQKVDGTLNASELKLNATEGKNTLDGTVSAGSLTAEADVDVAGTVTVDGAMTAKADLKQTGGTVAVGDTLTVDGALTQDGAEGTKIDVKNAMTVGGKLTQTQGTIEAGSLALNALASGDAEHPTVNKVSGTVDVKGDVKAVADLEQSGENSKITAKNVTAANVTQKDGTMNVTEKVEASTGDVVQEKGTMTAATVKAKKNVTQSGGEMIATTITAATVSQNGDGAKIVANGTSLAINADVTQTKGQIGGTEKKDGVDVPSDDVKIDGELTQRSDGTIYAKDLTATKNATVEGDITASGAMAVGGKLTQKAGEVDAMSVKAAEVEQTGGTLTAGAVKVDGKVTQSGGTMTVDATKAAGATLPDGMTAGTLTAGGNLDQSGAGSSLTAKNVTAANVTQKDGTMNVTTKIEASTGEGDGKVLGTVTQNGGEMSATTVEAKTVTQTTVTKDDGTKTTSQLTAKTIIAETTTQDGADAKILAQGNSLTVNGDLVQKNGTIATASDTVTVNGKVDQTGGTLNAETLDVTGTLDQDGATAKIDVENAMTVGGKLTQTQGTIEAGSLTAKSGMETSGKVTVESGDISVTGDLTQKDGVIKAENGDVSATGNLVQEKGEMTAENVTAANVTQKDGTMNVTDKIEATAGNVNQDNGTMTATDVKASVNVKQTGGEMIATTITAAKVEQNAEGEKTAKIVANGDKKTLTINADVEQTKGQIGNVSEADVKTDEVEVNGVLTQKADGEINATKLDLNASASVDAEHPTVNVVAGNVNVDGAMTVKADLKQTGGTVNADSLGVTGALTQDGATAKIDVENAMTVGGKLTQKAGEVDAMSVKAAEVEQTGGTLTAGAVKVDGKVTQSGGTMTVDATKAAGATLPDGMTAGTLTAGGNLDQSGAGSKLTAKNVTAANVTQKDGTMTVTEKVEATAGDVVQEKGTMTAATVKAKKNVKQSGGTMTATDVAAVENVEQTDGEMKATTVTATNVSQDGDDAKIVANGDKLTINADVTQTKGQIGNVSEADVKTDEVEVNGVLTQKADGEINATKLDLNASASVDAEHPTVNVVAGNVNVDGAMTVKADLKQTGGTLNAETLGVTGTLDQDGATAKIDVENAMTVGGKLTQKAGEVDAMSVKAAEVEQTGGTLTAGAVKVDGKVTQSGGTMTVDATKAAGATLPTGMEAGKLVAGGDLEQSGAGSKLTAKNVTAANVTQKDGTMNVTEKVEASTGEGDDKVLGKVTQNGGEMSATTVEAKTVTQTTVTKDDGTKTTSQLTAKTIIAETTTQDGADAKILAQGNSLTVNGDLVQKNGTIATASDTVTVNGKVDQTGGTLNAETLDVTGTLDQDGATAKIDVENAMTVGGKLTQTQGTIEAGSLALNAHASGDAEHPTVNKVSGTVDVKGDMKVVADLEQSGADSSLTAANVTAANVTQKDGTMNVTEKVEASTGEGDDKVLGKVTQNGGTMKTAEIVASMVTQEQKDGKTASIEATANKLTIDAALTQESGTIGQADKSDVITVTGTLTQNGGTINANSLDLDASASGDAEHPTVNKVSGTVDVKGDMKVVADLEQSGADSSLTAANVTAANVTQKDGTMNVKTKIEASTGDVVQEKGTMTATTVKAKENVTQSGGTMTATTVKAGENVDQTGGTIAATTITAKNVTQKTVKDETTGEAGPKSEIIAKDSSLTINAALEQTDGTIGEEGRKDNVTLNGDVTQNGGKINADTLTLQNGNVTQESKGKIDANTLAFSNSKGVTLNGDNTIDKIGGGHVGSLDMRVNGNLELSGKITASGNVTLNVNGTLTQTVGDHTVEIKKGYVSGDGINENAVAIEANNGTVTLNAKTIGGDSSKNSQDYVVVKADTVTAKANGGDASIAGIGGLTVKGDGSKDANVGISGENVYVYTDGKLKTLNDSQIKADDTLVITAKDYDYKDDIIRVSIGKDLQVNNFKKNGLLIVALDRVEGKKNPHFDHKPNNVLVFLDGRLIGGDIMALNRLAAMEAFATQTPELKSKQGVFGDPIFLHDELDIANPLEVGVIDFLLQDIPLLTLTSDFPLEIDKQVAAVGLNPTTSYWFGQNHAAADEEEESESEEAGE